MELELGMKKYCHLVDIFYNYNFRRCLLASPIHKVQGAVNDSCVRKGPTVDIADINSKHN